MESAHIAIENARTKIAMVLAAGAFVLGASGCTSPGEDHPRPSSSATAEAHYPVNSGADTFQTTGEAISGSDSLSDLIDSRNLAFDVEDEAQKRIDDEGMQEYKNAESEAYTLFENKDPKADTLRDETPARVSAPLIDFMLNSKGDLVFEDKTASKGLSDEERQIVSAVDHVKQILKPAMRAGDVNTVHIRILKPDTDDIDYQFPEESSAQYISQDFNDAPDGSKKSIYYFMRAEDYQHVPDMEKVLVHESAHAMLGQRAYDGSDYDTTDRQTLSKACAVIRESAMQTIADNHSTIVNDLQSLQAMVKGKYKPIYETVIKALEKGTYDQLPNEKDFNHMPECYLQNPWSAFITQARAKKGFDYPKHVAGNVDLGTYEQYMQDMIDRYNEILNENKVYQALNESHYMQGDDVEKWGHTNEGVGETTASIAGLIMDAPDTFGKNVNKLDPPQKQAVMNIVERDVQKLMLLHMHDADYQKFLGDQHSLFLANAV